MMAEGLTEAEALRRNWLVDSRGLVVKGRTGLTEHKLRYAHDQGADRRLPDGDRNTQADGDHRRRRGRRRLHARGAADDGADQRAADRVRALEPDVESRMLGRAGLSFTPRGARCSPAAAPTIR